MPRKHYSFKCEVDDVVQRTIVWGGKTCENPTICGCEEFQNVESADVFPWYQFVDTEVQPQPAKSCRVRAELVEDADFRTLGDPIDPPTCPHPPC